MKPCIGCGKTPTYYLSEVSKCYCTACVDKMMDIVHGLSPECVQVCVDAVKASKRRRYHDIRCAEFQCETCGALSHSEALAMIAAIKLLPKEE